MNPYTTKVIEEMELYGGSFVEALATAFRRADQKNFEKLKAAFPEIWNQYQLIADHNMKKAYFMMEKEQCSCGLEWGHTGKHNHIGV
jgi:hypothetical protein